MGASCKLKAVGCGLAAVSCGLSAVSCGLCFRLLAVCFRRFGLCAVGFGFWASALGCGLSAVGCGVSALGCGLSAFCCGLSALGFGLSALDCGLFGLGCRLCRSAPALGACCWRCVVAVGPDSFSICWPALWFWVCVRFVWRSDLALGASHSFSEESFWVMPWTFFSMWNRCRIVDSRRPSGGQVGHFFRMPALGFCIFRPQRRRCVPPSFVP